MKLDELFRSLHTIEIFIFDEENKKGKEIAFQSVHKEVSLHKSKSSNDNINESIAMLTKKFFKVVKKFRNTYNYGSNSRDQNNYKLKEFDKLSAKMSDPSNVGSVKDMVIIKQNAPTFLGDGRKVLVLLSLMRSLMTMMEKENIIELLLVSCQKMTLYMC